MTNIFVQLGVILGLVSLLGFITSKLKLPIIIAYLIGGLLLALTAVVDARTSEVLSFLPGIGIAFVLFLIGMELDLREIKAFSKQILTAGIFQVVVTSVLGTFLAQTFGYSFTEAIYLGVGLSFSSTLVVVKLLLDKRELGSLYGKLSLGVLLLEDIIAVIILLGFSSSVSFVGAGSIQLLLFTKFAFKVFTLFVVTIWISRYLLQWIFKAVSESAELLFLTALAWCFVYITFASWLGFSSLIGAFLAGVALASSPYHFQIQGKIKPMRDFFAALFFVYLGTNVNFAHISSDLPLIAIFTAYAVVIKPLIFLLLFGMFGFRKHTMFHTAINLSQVSEFSLIVLLTGFKAGVVSSTALTVIALSSVLSFIISSLMISRSDELYKSLVWLVAFFERKRQRRILEGAPEDRDLENHAVIIGAHRVGGEIVKFFQKEGIPLVVLDLNPKLVEFLLKEKVPVIFGDMGDPDILDVLNLPSARIIISTSPSFHENKLLLQELKLRRVLTTVIMRAETAEDARALYKAGADYVIIPEVLAGEILVDKLKDHLSDKSYFRDRPRIEMERLHKKTFAWE